MCITLLILRRWDRDPCGPPVVPRTLECSLEFVRLKSLIPSLQCADHRNQDNVRLKPERPNEFSADRASQNVRPHWKWIGLQETRRDSLCHLLLRRVGYLRRGDQRKRRNEMSVAPAPQSPTTNKSCQAHGETPLGMLNDLSIAIMRCRTGR
jgi:hypothetical protein